MSRKLLSALKSQSSDGQDCDGRLFEDILDSMAFFEPLFDKNLLVQDPAASLSASSFQFETSTFSGWSTIVGISAAFNKVRFRVREHSGAAPTSIRVTVRESSYGGTVLGDQTVAWSERDVDGYVTVSFNSVINSANPICFQFAADDKASFFGVSGGSTSAESRYTTNGIQTGLSWQAVTSGSYRQYVEFLNDDNDIVFSSVALGQLNDDLNIDILNITQDGVKYIFDLGREVVGESVAESSAAWRFETSTFSGWSTRVGTVSGDWTNVRFRIREHSGSSPMSIRVIVRETSVTGPILADRTVDWVDRDANGYLEVFFGETLNSAAELYFQFQADDKASLYAASGGAAGETDYTTNGNQHGLFGDSASDWITWVQFRNDTIAASLTDAGREVVGQHVPRLNLPPRLYAQQGEVLQLFHRSIIEALDPYQYSVKITGANLGDNTYSEAENYPRYVEMNPQSAGSRSLQYQLFNDKNVLLAEQTLPVTVVNRTAGPASNMKVLCVGDSLTAGGTYVTELNRLLTGSGGSPPGKGFSNIEFIGSQGSGANLHEGRSGWSWTTFSNPGSPLFNGGSLDWNNYIASTLSDTTVDQVYFFLSWNSWTDALKRNASDWAAEVAHAKAIIDGLHTAFPSAKVTLMGLQLPSLNGGLTANYGDGSGAYGNKWQMIQSVFGLNQAWQSMILEPTYSGFCDFIDVACQFDSENNMPETDTPVNSRSSKTEKLGNNGVHPSTEGYYQIADAVYRHFLAKYCT
ncbi:MAG: hypothetical protein Aurels2KO_10490 [Aureliella sp.]